MHKLLSHGHYIPVIGCELECYAPQGLVLASSVLKTLQHQLSTGVTFQPEKQPGQYELIFDHTSDMTRLTDTITTTRTQLENQGFSFLALPFIDKPASGMHIHIHLEDIQGNNIFVKPHGQDTETPHLQSALAGLLDALICDIDIFAPTANCKLRYGHDHFSPSYVCWGGNNRTAAIRLPTSTANPESRHIEHRMASPLANPKTVIDVLLQAIDKGITENLPLTHPKLYGNAKDTIYNLTPLLS